MDINTAKKNLESAIKHFEDQSKKLRTGRANAGMLDSVKVEVYGQEMPLTHIASVSVLDAQMIQISPFDPNNLEAISAAIRNDQTLSLNPADDGRVVRVPIPPMTTERRQEVVKLLHERVEQAKISFRNSRHDYLNSLKQQEQDKEISEDEKKRSEKEFNDVLDEYNSKLEALAQAKEEEIMSI